MKSRISSKGQVTVPAAVRDALGLDAGTVVEFVVREGDVVLRKGSGSDHPVDRVFGRLKLGRPVDEVIDDLRDEVAGAAPRKPPRPKRRR